MQPLRNRYIFFGYLPLSWGKGTLLFFALSLMLGGCSSHVAYQQDAEIYAASVLTKLEESIAVKAQAGLTGDLRISFKESCLNAAVTDNQIMTILADLEKARIDVDEAATHKWPRLSAQAQAEIPFAGDNANELDVTGGLYFKYDIWRAIAEPDEIALRQALVEKDLRKLHLQLNGIAGEIANQLTMLALIDFKIAKKNEALSAARQALELVRLYADQNKKEGLDFLYWKKTEHTLTGEVRRLEQAKREKNEKLLSLLGAGSNAKVVITDADETLVKIEQVPAGMVSAAAIWENHSEARLAEVEYVAAEVNIKLAEMDRLPKVNASLGLGSIPLTSDSTDAASLFQLSMELPLWDAGDHERKMARAQIERGLVRERMETKALSLWRRAESARLQYGDALQDSAYLKKFYQDSLSLLNSRKLLVEEERLSNLDLLRDTIELVDVAIMEKEADFKVREAAANYRFAIGLDIVEDIIPAIEKSLLLSAGRLKNEKPVNHGVLDAAAE